MASGAVNDPLLEQLQQPPDRMGDETIAGRLLAACAAIGYGRQKTLARLHSAKEGRERSMLSPIVSSLEKFYKQFLLEMNSLSLPLKAGLAALLCSAFVFVPTPVRAFGAWAVVAVDLMLETNVGFTIQDGINRTVGSFAAAALALAVNVLGFMCGEWKPYFLVFWVFFGGALAKMFRPHFGDRWKIAVATTLVAFHVLILTPSGLGDGIKFPLIYAVMMVIGLLCATLVSLSFSPKYAGSKINDLVANNLERAGNVMESCVLAYCEGVQLDQVQQNMPPGSISEDENFHMSFHELMSPGNEVDNLLKAVPFEPCHGKFFRGYPWDVYEDIVHHLKHLHFDIVALDSCLHSEIQAPVHLRHIFMGELQCIGKECGQVFRSLGESIREMRSVYCGRPLEQAEEGVLLLQHKIAKCTPLLIEGGYPDASWYEVQSGDDHILTTPESYLGTAQPPAERSEIKKSDGSGKSKTRPRLAEGHEDFLQRQETLGRNWDTTVQRISTLSLIKFAALLIGIVVKAKYMVTIVDEVKLKARFEETPEGRCRVK